MDTFATPPPSLEIKGTLPRDPRLLPRDHATFLRDSLRETAAEHHTRHIPRHFEPFAIAKYGYRPRSNRYRKLKQRLGLPDKPLVFSGSSRTSVLGSRQITATQKRATLKMRMALQGFDALGNRVTISASGRFRRQQGQLTLSHAQSQILERIIELRSIASDEERYLAEFLRTKYTERANAPGVQHRVRKTRSKGA